MQKHVNLVDLVKSFPTNIYLQNLASIQQRTSLVQFDYLDEKSEKGSISNLSTKEATRASAEAGPAAVRRIGGENAWCQSRTSSSGSRRTAEARKGGIAPRAGAAKRRAAATAAKKQKNIVPA